MTKRRTSSRRPKRDGEFWFDEAAADRAVEFFERFLVHVKGRWAGCRFLLEPWERDDIIRPIFGWKRLDGTRRYRVAYIEIPRKNGKSALSAGIALYLLFADAEPGAEIYSAAGDREQAAIVFEAGKAMVRASPPLDRRAEMFKRVITVPKTGASYKVLSADAPTKHGLNAHGVIFDELHVQPNRALWDVLTTSVGARSQPLVVAITTAGYDRQSICFEQHDYARKVGKGIIDDPSYFAYIAAASEADDWRSPKTWKKANPNLGVTISLEYLKQEAQRAEKVPAYQNTFRRLHLNQWVSQETRWLDLTKWDESAGLVVPEKLKGRACYGGLDLASSLDLTAFVLVFPPEEADGPCDVLSYFWVPAEDLRERGRKDGAPYETWVRSGLLHATEGNVIHYEAIRRKIEDLGKTYDIKEIAYDRWGAIQISQQLTDAGFTMVPMGQGFGSMSAPTKELLNLVLSRKLRHGGNPVLRWMADNMVVRQDPAGNVKPDKGKSTKRIDGMVALIMAIDRAVRLKTVESVYEQRGLLAV